MNGQQRPRVLLVDDEASPRETLAKYLRQTYGYHVDAAADTKEALAWLEDKQGDFNVALVDDLLPAELGREPEFLCVNLIVEIKARYPDIELLLLTDRDLKEGLEALRASVHRYIINY